MWLAHYAGNFCFFSFRLIKQMAAAEFSNNKYHCYTDNSESPISANYDRIEAAKQAFLTKYKDKPQSNPFSLYFYDAVSKQAFANTLPETFESELERYVLQSMAGGYDANNVLKSVHTSLPAFIHSIKFQIYETEMDRRRDVVLYRNTRPEAECRPVYTSLTAGDEFQTRRDAIDDQQANINDVCKRRIFSDESLLYANPNADMLYNNTMNRLGSTRQTLQGMATELPQYRSMERRVGAERIPTGRPRNPDETSQVHRSIQDYNMSSDRIESILARIER